MSVSLSCPALAWASQTQRFQECPEAMLGCRESATGSNVCSRAGCCLLVQLPDSDLGRDSALAGVVAVGESGRIFGRHRCPEIAVEARARSPAVLVDEVGVSRVLWHTLLPSGSPPLPCFSPTSKAIPLHQFLQYLSHSQIWRSLSTREFLNILLNSLISPISHNLWLPLEYKAW